jgi:hypothetical protein
MGTPMAPSPASGSGLPPEVEGQLKAAEIAAKTARRNTWLTVIGGILVALITGLTTYYAGHGSNTGTSGPVSQLTLDPFGAPNGDSNIGWTVSLSGPVSGLRPGQMVWTFNEPLQEPRTYYPDTGPCSVSAGTWTCDGVHIGVEGTAGLGKYRIWAVVVSTSDAFNIVNVLRCLPSGIPGVRGVKINPACPDLFSSLPGNDVVQPQSIEVTRTH